MSSTTANEFPGMSWVETFRDIPRSDDIGGRTDYCQAGGYPLRPRSPGRHTLPAGRRRRQLVSERPPSPELAAAANRYRGRPAPDDPADEPLDGLVPE